jgi:hypothetical protein
VENDSLAGAGGQDQDGDRLSYWSIPSKQLDPILWAWTNCQSLDEALTQWIRSYLHEGDSNPYLPFVFSRRFLRTSPVESCVQGVHYDIEPPDFR